MTAHAPIRPAIRALGLAALFVALPAFAQKQPARTDAPTPKPRQDVARFRRRVEAALAEAGAQKAYWGVLIEDAASGELLYELNSTRSFVPASNTKLFTTALAMATLGPEYRYHTTIESHGTLGEDGRLRGDLILVGRGDPDLSNRKFPYAGKVERDGPVDKTLEEMADEVVARGVKEIDGDIVGDDSYFPFDPYPAEWTVGDLYFSFGAPVSAIVVNDNWLTLSITPGEQPGAAAHVEIEPWDGRGTLDHEITTGPAGSERKLEVIRQPGPFPMLLRGSIPLNAAAYKLDLAVEEPAEYAARVLKRLLEARGAIVTGGVRAQHALLPPGNGITLPAAAQAIAAAAPPAPLVLAEHSSPSLLEIIRLTNKVSENLHAELLLRTVAKEKSGIGSTEAGLQLEKDFLKSIGIANGDVALFDGSGLSRGNLVTPRATVTLLRWIAQQPWGDAFVSTLAIAGKDGTLEPRMKGSPAVNRIQAKTGAHEHVRALSGFATTVRGERLVFSMFGNNSPNSGVEVNNILDDIAVAMVEELGARPLPARKKP